MPHRGRQLRRAGAYHLGPRPPLLPLLGRLLGECLRRGGEVRRAPGLQPARDGTAGSKFGARTLGPSCGSAGCSSENSGLNNSGDLTHRSRASLSLSYSAIPRVTFLGGNRSQAPALRRACSGRGDRRLRGGLRVRVRPRGLHWALRDSARWGPATRSGPARCRLSSQEALTEAGTRGRIRVRGCDSARVSPARRRELGAGATGRVRSCCGSARARSLAGPPAATSRLGVVDLAFPACVRNGLWAAGLGRRPETRVRGRVF